MLDDDAGHVFLARLTNDRVVVARGSVRVVVVLVVAGLDAAIREAQRGELVLDIAGQRPALRVGPVVVGRGVAVPDFRAVRDGRGGVEVDRHERISVGGCCRIDAARQVGAEVFGRTDVRLASHDDGDAVVGLEFFFESQGDREGQVLFSQAVGDCARVGTPMPGVDGDDNAVGRVRGRHQGRDGSAERQGKPGCECPPRRSHSHPSGC